VFEGEGLWNAINRFLLQYRSTPTTTTGETPAELLMGRTIRTKLDFIHPNLEEKVILQQFKIPGLIREAGSFDPGQEIYYRIFPLQKDNMKFVPGHIIKQTSTLTYLIRATNGDEIYRHFVQIKSRLLNVSDESDEDDLSQCSKLPLHNVHTDRQCTGHNSAFTHTIGSPRRKAGVCSFSGENLGNSSPLHTTNYATDHFSNRNCNDSFNVLSDPEIIFNSLNCTKGVTFAHNNSDNVSLLSDTGVTGSPLYGEDEEISLLFQKTRVVQSQLTEEELFNHQFDIRSSPSSDLENNNFVVHSSRPREVVNNLLGPLIDIDNQDTQLLTDNDDSSDDENYGFTSGRFLNNNAYRGCRRDSSQMTDEQKHWCLQNNPWLAPSNPHTGLYELSIPKKSLSSKSTRVNLNMPPRARYPPNRYI
jgi:hypothetical protein